MTTRSPVRSALRWISAAIGLAAGAYATYAGIAWLRYGHASPSTSEDEDAALDQLMPAYDVVERHHIRVRAPAEITFSAACEVDVMQPLVVRAIFKARERILGSQPATETHPRGLLAWTKSIGWGVLAEVPGREIVMGAVTRPWEADVVFRPLPPNEFTSFNDSDYVKIAWTLRADPLSATESVFRTETRVVATDATARTKFRRYWSFLSPGIILIRWMTLRPVKIEAERRAQLQRSADPEP